MIGKNLKAAREAAGMTQADAARATGLSIQTISDQERGLFAPKDPNMKVLAKAYGTTAAALRYGENGGQPMVVRESPSAYRAPLIARDLPKSVRVWLHEFLLELAEADVPDEQIDAAKRALIAPENLDFFVGSSPGARYEEEAMQGLQSFAGHIRNVLRDRGFKVRAK
ncbi:MAG: helix-turn-helix transcriptional regulator [Gemmatimonadaceae bacterium]